MCDRHHAPRPDRAIALEHGHAHDRDHAAWSRRQFLTRGAAAAGGTAFLLGGLPVHATSGSSILHALAQLPTDRVLVLIQLAGGNDGLNTVVPVTNDLYYQRRPTIAIPQAQTFALNDDYGLPLSMQGLQPLWGEGDMAVLHGVGYPDHNLSHFRSTDIWASGSDSDTVLNSGWTGRYLDVEYPDYVQSPPEFPVAIRIGGASALLLRGAATSMGMSFSSPSQFTQLATTGEFYDEGNVPDNVFGEELSFIRSVYNASLRYRDAVVNAADAGQNEAPYPGGNLSESLSAVARLIKGNLGSRLYVVQLGGFDTHSDQAMRQPGLLQSLADSVAAFTEDLATGGRGQDVLTMTFSEFGRRVEENGSNGTDHGTAAPLFLFGDGVNGGLYGQGPDLVNVDGSGNMFHSTDFRAVYETILRSWFGLTEASASGVLGGSFGTMPFVADPVANEPVGAPSAFVLEAPHPNPFRDAATVAFALQRPGRVSLDVLDVRGRTVATLADEPRTAGRHVLRFAPDRLPSGTYFLRLQTEAGVQTRPLTLVR